MGLALKPYSVVPERVLHIFTITQSDVIPVSTLAPDIARFRDNHLVASLYEQAVLQYVRNHAITVLACGAEVSALYGEGH